MGKSKKRQNDSDDDERRSRKKRRPEKHKESDERETKSTSLFRKKKRSSSPSSTSSSSSSRSCRKEKKKLKRKKKKKEKKKNEMKKNEKRAWEQPTRSERSIGPVDSSSSQFVAAAAANQTSHSPAPSSRSMAPMTKEEWEKRQSVVRRVFDPLSGRHRLVKGDGEILEECVSKERHREINEIATRGDGVAFQTQLRLLNK